MTIPKIPPLEVPDHYGPERRGFHIDRTIGISDFLTAIPMIIAIVVFGLGIQARIETGEYRMRSMEERAAEDRRTAERQRAEDLARQERERSELLMRLQDVSTKVDKLLEYQIKGER